MMETSRQFNLSADNTSSSGVLTGRICYNMDARFFAIGDFLDWYIANLIVNTVLAIAASLENLLILITIWRTSTLHTPSHVLLFCLALSDLGVGLLAQPLVVIYTATKIRGFISVACVSGAAAAVLSTYLCGVSLLSITAVSIDRYLALHLHLRYKQLVTNKRVIALLVCTWLFAALVLFTWLWYPPLISFIIVAIGLGCIAITTFCFCRIYFVLRHHHHKNMCLQVRPNSSIKTSNEALISKHYKHSVLVIFMVYILLLLFYIPCICISYVIVVQGTTLTNRLLFELARTVVFANSSINPLLYCWRLRDIRAAVTRLLPCV